MTTTERHLGSTGSNTSSDLAYHDPRTPVRMVEFVARSAVEIVRAQRPVTALNRVVTPEIAMMLKRRYELTTRLRLTSRPPAPQRVMITGVRTCIVNERAVEASCVLRDRDRARFIAMRWELRHNHWRVTALEIG